VKKCDPRSLAEFGARVTALTDRFVSVADAARKLGIKEQTLRNARDGLGEPRAPLLLALSQGLNVSMEYLLGVIDDPTPPPTILGGRSPALMVQKLDIRAAAGGGAANEGATVEETLEFPLWMAQKLARNVSRLRLLRAAGDSMEPTIRNGALLLVDEGDRELPKKPPKSRNPWDDRDLYVFTQDDEVRVKRLRLDKRGHVLALSDNPAYDPEILRRQDFKIEGRVVWWDNRL